jgi:transcriptional regulator with XRE-family HTH domain
MLRTDIRRYRTQEDLTQQQLAERTFLNQTIISDLEVGKPYAIKQWEGRHERFTALKSLIETSSKGEPIEIFHRSALPDRFNVETDHGAEWIAVTPESRLLECRSLFADRDDVAIVTKVD